MGNDYSAVRILEMTMMILEVRVEVEKNGIRL